MGTLGIQIGTYLAFLEQSIRSWLRGTKCDNLSCEACPQGSMTESMRRSESPVVDVTAWLVEVRRGRYGGAFAWWQNSLNPGRERGEQRVPFQLVGLGMSNDSNPNHLTCNRGGFNVMLRQIAAPTSAGRWTNYLGTRQDDQENNNR